MNVVKPLYPKLTNNITKLLRGRSVLQQTVTACRPLSQQSTDGQLQNDLSPKEGKFCAWQIHSYGGLEELQLSCAAREPIISSPEDVIVDVAACSVNPIDVHMMRGYGATLLANMRAKIHCNSAQEFPLTLGRDFSGQVTSVGHGVKTIKPGDEVWGVVPPTLQGCHAQRITVDQKRVRHKPKCLSMEEAASILYVAVTAWSALRITGDIFFGNARGKRILILGASGGVGSVAVQMAKAWGAEVVGTCRTDAVPYVESLGAHTVIDYALPNFVKRLHSEEQFDIVLDAAGVGQDAGEYISVLKQWSNAKYITLKSPLLKNIDEHGLVAGIARSTVDLVQPNISSGLLARGASFRWAYFFPSEAALDEIQLLVEAGKVTPNIHKVYSFKDMPSAFKQVMDGHLRGKIVVSLKT